MPHPSASTSRLAGRSARRWAGAALSACLPLLAGLPAQAGTSLLTRSPIDHPVIAQRESYLFGPGSSVGPATKVKPTNCVTAPDGAISCDTELQNSPGDTKARPQYELFNN